MILRNVKLPSSGCWLWPPMPDRSRISNRWPDPCMPPLRRCSETGTRWSRRWLPEDSLWSTNSPSRLPKPCSSLIWCNRSMLEAGVSRCPAMTSSLMTASWWLHQAPPLPLHQLVVVHWCPAASPRFESCCVWPVMLASLILFIVSWMFKQNTRFGQRLVLPFIEQHPPPHPQPRQRYQLYLPWW